MMSDTNMRVFSCARCGLDHDELEIKELTRPFAPLETKIKWTHWMTCPTNGEPILLTYEAEPV